MAIASAAAFVLLASAPALTGGEFPKAIFADCEARVHRSPHDQESYSCFYLAGRRYGVLPEAARTLERIMRQPSADRNWARLFVALIAADLGQSRAEQLFDEAIAAFTTDQNAEGVVLARLGLARFLRLGARITDADRQAAAAAPIAAASADPTLAARVAVEQAFIEYNKADYGRAWNLLKDVEAVTFSSAPIYVQSTWLSAMGATCWATNRWPEALDAYRRQAKLLHDAGDRYGEITARDNTLFLLSSYGMSREELAAAAREQLALAEQRGNWESQARALIYLAEASPPDLALGYSRRALTIARQHAPDAVAVARRAVAWYLLTSDPDQAFALIDEAISEARRRGDSGEVARDLVSRSDMRWVAGPRSAAIADSIAAIDTAEAIRNLQPEPLVRARRFSAWSAPYSRLVNRLFAGTLSENGGPSDADFELAFSVMERRRARMLLDEVGAASHTVQGPSADVSARAPRFPALNDLRSAIAPDEAVLAFQVSGRAVDPTVGSTTRVRSGSWVVVHTRGGSKVYEIPDDNDLDTAVSLFNGLLARRDGSEQSGARRLYRNLLQRAIANLPAEIDRLIIVPDETLYDVPFPALRDTDGQPIGARYEIATVPSVTAWIGWRRSVDHTRQPAAVALADPVLAAAPAGAADSRLRDAARLGPLPEARREAASLQRPFGDVTIRVGADASEHFIKTTNLRRHTLLHIAAHGLVDDANPDRSALLLASGSNDEDGILNRDEIARLRLDGVVVLSACRSASGTRLSGEGVLGLAHAFFQTGARTVVASLWPLRDDEAADLFQRFYEELAKGVSVNAAVKAVRVGAIASGKPAAAWAGIVVLGNGEIVPVPGGARHGVFRIAAAMVILAALVAALGFEARRRAAARRPLAAR